MGNLVPGTDGSPAEEVGEWIEQKHFIVTEYVKLSHGARRQFLPPNLGGATYIDLFCGPGQAKIKGTKQYVDGAAVAAWKTAKQRGSPFTKVYIADRDIERRELCASRLRVLGAPVIEIEGEAAEAAQNLSKELPPEGLHFAFLDPYNLGSLSFNLLRSLAQFRRMDILVHISAMDLFRNMESQSADDVANEFNAFAPGWREMVPIGLPKQERRDKIMKHWADCVSGQLGLDASSEMHAVLNNKKRVIYWLLLLHRHNLAKKFWKIVLKGRPQRTQEMQFGE